MPTLVVRFCFVIDFLILTPSNVFCIISSIYFLKSLVLYYFEITTLSNSWCLDFCIFMKVKLYYLDVFKLFLKAILLHTCTWSYWCTRSWLKNICLRILLEILLTINQKWMCKNQQSWYCFEIVLLIKICLIFLHIANVLMF